MYKEIHEIVNIYNNKLYNDRTHRESEGYKNPNIYDINRTLFSNNQWVYTSNLENKLIISHVLVFETIKKYENNQQRTIENVLKQIVAVSKENITFLHDGEFTNQCSTGRSLCKITFDQKPKENIINFDKNDDINKHIFFGTFLFGTYIDKNGYIYCALLKFDFDKNKINVQTFKKKLVIDFSDVYLYCTRDKICDRPGDAMLISFFLIYGNNFFNLDRNIFMGLHKNIPYICYQKKLKKKRKKFISNINNSESILDTYKIICHNNTSLIIKPIQFGHLISSKSILRNVFNNFTRDTTYFVDIDIDKLKIFFEFVIQNKIPRLYEIIENKLIENMLELKNLCDYFNIQIYLEYFDFIIGTYNFEKLFVASD